MATKFISVANLTDYHTQSLAETDEKYVGKVEGKGLSTKDYTAEDQTKLAGLLNIKAIGTGAAFDAETGTLNVTGGASDAGGITYGDKTVKEVLDELTYVAIQISSFTNNVNVAEVGSTVDAVTLAWSTNKTPTTVKLDGTAQDAASKGAALTKLGLTKDKTWTLEVGDGTKTATKTTSVYFKNKKYVGTAADGTIDSAFILALTGSFADNLKGDYPLTVNKGQYIFLACPAAWGTPQFWANGFQGGVDLVKTLDFTNASGGTVSYNVFRSTNSGLGTLTLTVK